MKNLKQLFRDGTAIEELPSSIDWYAPGLVSVDLTNCQRLRSLPIGICNLESLETLLLSNCSKLDSLPHDFGKLKRLRKLHADRTALRGLPDSFVDLGFTLQELSFNGFKGSAPSASWLLRWKKSYSLDFLIPQLSCFRSLRSLNLSNCNLKDGMLLHSLCLLSSLWDLDLSGNNFVRLPSSFRRLSGLRFLHWNDCRRLQTLSELPSSIGYKFARDCISPHRISNFLPKAINIQLINCLKLEDCPSIIKSMFRSEAHTTQLQNRSKYLKHMLVNLLQASIPGNEIPEWFSHQNEGCEVYIPPSPNQNSNIILGFAFCIVLDHKDMGDKFGFAASCSLDFYSLDGVSGSAGTSFLFYHIGLMKSDHLLLWLISSPPLKELHSIKISFTSPRAAKKIARCGVRLIYNEDMIEGMSASQPSSVVLQELNNSMDEGIEVNRTDGASLSVEDSQSEGTIDEENPNGTAAPPR